MNLIRNILPILAAMLLVATATVRAGEPAAPDASGLMSKVSRERWAAFRGIIEGRSKMVRDLISIADSKDADPYYQGPVHMAIGLLGRLRATEAVGVLSRRLMYLPLTPEGGYRVESSMGETQAYYPAAVSLALIGQPAVDAMVTKLSTADDVKEREEAAWVIMRIEGKDQALHRLDRLIEKDDRHKDRYQEARSFIANYKPDYRHPLKRAQEEQKAAGKSAGPASGANDGKP